jgi:hypothetical protein
MDHGKRPTNATAVAISDASRNLTPPWWRPVRREPTSSARPMIGTSSNMAGTRDAAKATSKPSEINLAHAPSQWVKRYGAWPPNWQSAPRSHGDAA